MKKAIAICVLALLFAFLFGCIRSEIIYQRFEVQAVVLDCKLISSTTDQKYSSLPIYNYRITIQLDDGNKYTVIRHQEYEIGDTITVILEKAFDEDNQLISITCK